MADLATIYHRQGRLDESSFWSCSCGKKVLGEERQDTLRTKVDLTAIYRQQEQSAIYGQAEQPADEGAISVDEVELRTCLVEPAPCLKQFPVQS